eukprot:scaffold2390_cov280-Prasinococcus_capsulatus_cf.AAC.4
MVGWISPRSVARYLPDTQKDPPAGCMGPVQLAPSMCLRSQSRLWSRSTLEARKIQRLVQVGTATEGVAQVVVGKEMAEEKAATELLAHMPECLWESMTSAQPRVGALQYSCHLHTLRLGS